MPTMKEDMLAFALPSLDGIGKIVVFLVMLSVLVVLHEAGHFLLSRLNGVRVNDFAVGFGPTLFKWTSPRSGTNYRLNLLPIGGYCAMQGEDANVSEAEQQREFLAESSGANADVAVAPHPGYGGGLATLERPSAIRSFERNAKLTKSERAASDNFQAKTTWQRLSIIVAGPVANFLLAYAILFVGAVTFGVASDHSSTKIGPVTAGSPAAKAGLQFGDQIDAIDGVAYTSGETLVKKIQSSAGVPLSVTVSHHGTTRTESITPSAVKVAGKTVGRIGFVRIPAFERVGFFAAIPVAGTEFYNAITGQIGGYASLIRHPKEAGASISGPIGMERAAASYQDLGWGPYLELAAMISIALGLINLLPFPALDGGRGVFIVAEMLRGKPVGPEREAFVHVAGFAVLMVLMVFVAFHDISNIVSGKGAF